MMNEVKRTVEGKMGQRAKTEDVRTYGSIFLRERGKPTSERTLELGREIKRGETLVRFPTESIQSRGLLDFGSR